MTAIPKIPDRPPVSSRRSLDFELDLYDLEHFEAVVGGFGQERFEYVVTPNVDHLIRLSNSESFREYYSAAAYVLLDSRLLARLLRLVRHLSFPVCTGSDLTRRLFERIAAADDRIVLVGGSAQQADTLRQRYGLNTLMHYDPPMGFVHDPAEVERCIAFVESCSPFRFCLLAVGSPQQEVLAHSLQQRARARGLALCVGASINYLTGVERRAPLWMQRQGLEWLYRLLQNPKRLARRYLLGAPKLLALLLFGHFKARRSGGRTGAALPHPGSASHA